MKSADPAFDWGKSSTPVCSLRITVPQESRDEYFARVERFAQSNNFEVRIARLHPDNEVFAIDFWREDIAVAGENVFNPADFEFDFYVHPDRGGSTDAALQLMAEFEGKLSDVSGIKITRKE
jgi:hypothetical protein